MGGVVSGEKQRQAQFHPTPTLQLLEFDSTNVSDTAAKPPGTPYPPYSLADFSWNNITDSLDPATLSATFQGHPMNDPTRTFANGSLAFRVRGRKLERLKKADLRGWDLMMEVALKNRHPAISHTSHASSFLGPGLFRVQPTSPTPSPPAHSRHLSARGGPGWSLSPRKPFPVWAGGSHTGPGP